MRKWFLVILTCLGLEANASNCNALRLAPDLSQKISSELLAGDHLIQLGNNRGALLRFQTAQGLLHQHCGVWTWEQATVVERIISATPAKAVHQHVRLEKFLYLLAERNLGLSNTLLHESSIRLGNAYLNAERYQDALFMFEQATDLLEIKINSTPADTLAQKQLKDQLSLVSVYADISAKWMFESPEKQGAYSSALALLLD